MDSERPIMVRIPNRDQSKGCNGRTLGESVKRLEVALWRHVPITWGRRKWIRMPTYRRYPDQGVKQHIHRKLKGDDRRNKRATKMLRANVQGS